MPVFEYVALDAGGKRQRGVIEAENPRIARQRLKGQQIFATDLRESNKPLSSSQKRDVKRFFAPTKISIKELSILTRQMATLLVAGLPLVSTLQALSEQTDSELLQRMLVQIREQVEQGNSFAKALAQFPKSFPALYINMIASGEASGTLDTVLTNMASYLEAQVELRRKIWSALTYPILMMVLCTAVIVGLLVFVIPRIVEIFIKQGAVLPLPTRIVIALSDSIIQFWPLIVAAGVGVVLGVRWYYRQPSGRDKIDNLLLKAPLYGSLNLKISVARITQTLATLLKSGVGLLTAMEIAKNILSNVHLIRAMDEARTGVQEGKSLARELAKSGRFPSLLTHMIGVGEKSGELETMLERSGKAYESEVNASLAGLTSLLEPLMMIVVGGVVLGIVVSVLLPMADLISIIQQ